MNRIILFTILLFTVSIVHSQTTQEEYDYLTKGYEESKRLGLDLKNGYTLEEIHKTDFEKYVFTYYAFTHVDTNKLKAVLIECVKVKDGKDNKIKYLVLPLDNRKLIKCFADDAMGLGVSMGLLYDVSFAEFTSVLLNRNYLITDTQTDTKQ